MTVKTQKNTGDNHYIPLFEYKGYHHRESIALTVIFAVILILFCGNDEATNSSEFPGGTIMGIALALIVGGWMLLPQTRLIVYRDHTIIRPLLGGPTRYRFSNDSVVSVTVVPDYPFVEARHRFLNIGRNWVPGSKWEGWIPCFEMYNEHAIAIETTKEKYLVSCNKPDKTGAKLNEIYGKSENN